MRTLHHLLIMSVLLALASAVVHADDDEALLQVISDNETVSIEVSGQGVKMTIRPGERVALRPGTYEVSAVLEPAGIYRKECVWLTSGHVTRPVFLFNVRNLADARRAPPLKAPDDWARLNDYAITRDGKTLRELRQRFNLSERHTQEIRLLAESQQIDDKERYYWLSVLSIMTDAQRAELRDILVTERRLLARSRKLDGIGIQMAYYDEAARFAPDSAWAQTRLAHYQACRGMVLAAEQSWMRALAIDEDNPHIRNNYAWMLATTPDDRYRDGETGERLLKPIIDSDASYYLLDTYAATLAAQGRFDEAVRYEKQAISHLDDGDERERARQRLERYQTKKPTVIKPICN